MALAQLHSVAFQGLEACLVAVEVDARTAAEQSSLVIVGLPDTAVRESKDRVLAAVRHSGLANHPVSATINLAPGDLRKEGPLYDLPVALGLITALQKMDETRTIPPYLVVGELALSGEIRPICGALAIALLARDRGLRGVIIPLANKAEAEAVPGIEVVAVGHLREAAAFLKNPQGIAPSAGLSDQLFKTLSPEVDFEDIIGQAHAKRALEVAAAGGHNVLLSGPPGTGKTLLAKALAGILPPLTVEEALEVTKIHSIAGLLNGNRDVVAQRPFRAPHHTVSYAGLIGGGHIPRPGEVSLAHQGVLFLDELPEFSRAVLEVLRQPLENGSVTIGRAHGNFTFPTRFLCIAAMNPCPCGMLGHPERSCQDTPLQIQRYQGRISGPLRDRFDMQIEVAPLRYTQLRQSAKSESSTQIQQRVKRARQRQQQRSGKPNAQLTARQTKEQCPLDNAGHSLLQQAMDGMGLSARGCDRLLRVALTLADLAGEETLHSDHLMEALSLRTHL